MSSISKIGQFIRDFFNYNHSEKKGILLLTFLLIFYLGYQYYQIEQYASEEFFDHSAFRLEIDEFIATKEQESNSKQLDVAFRKSDSLFLFNPNEITKVEAVQLGLNSTVISNLMKYREKGGYFRSKDDFKRIYGLKASTYSKLLPYIVITEAEAGEFLVEESDSIDIKESLMAPVDINHASDSILRQVRGIGATFSARILDYRKKLGGFVRKEQLMEVYGINNEIYQNLSPQLTIIDTVIHRLNINTADAPTLIQHPYINNWNQANAIVNFRRQHGLYETPDQLLKIQLIDSSFFFRIRPYITVK